MTAPVIRRAREEDAEAVSALIRRTLRISNLADYGPEEIGRLCGIYGPEGVRERIASLAFYVLEENGAVLGCGAAGPGNGKDEIRLTSVFVDPDFQGRGYGRRIMETLENEARGARSVRLSASLTAAGFYRALGFVPLNETPDEDRLLSMRKQFRNGDPG